MGGGNFYIPLALLMLIYATECYFMEKGVDSMLFQASICCKIANTYLTKQLITKFCTVFHINY